MAHRFAAEPTMAQTVAQLADAFNDAGMQQMDEAEAMLVAGEVEEGMLALQRLTVLRKLDVAKLATRRVAEVRRDPAARATMAESDAETLYGKAVDLLWSGPRGPDDTCPEGEMCEDCRRHAAIAETGASESTTSGPSAPSDDVEDIPAEVRAAWLLPSQQQIDLFRTLRLVIERYPESRAALTARWTLDALETDPVLVSAVQRAEAEAAAARVLQLAENYLNNGRRDSGRALLSEVVRDYPGTDAAQRAQEVLDAGNGE